MSGDPAYCPLVVSMPEQKDPEAELTTQERHLTPTLAPLWDMQKRRVRPCPHLRLSG